MQRNLPTYTTKMHVYRLEKMLSKDENLRRCCPAARNFDCNESAKIFWSRNTNPCEICASFVGIEEDNCPCYAISCIEAYKRTLEAIKKYRKENPK